MDLLRKAASPASRMLSLSLKDYFIVSPEWRNTKEYKQKNDLERTLECLL